jgi:hypothetical protein
MIDKQDQPLKDRANNKDVLRRSRAFKRQKCKDPRHTLDRHKHSKRFHPTRQPPGQVSRAGNNSVLRRAPTHVAHAATSRCHGP